MKDKLDKLGYLKVHSKESPLKAIREKCLDCCAGQHAEVRICHLTDCALWPFRIGKNPFHKRAMTDKQKKDATNRILK